MKTIEIAYSSTPMPCVFPEENGCKGGSVCSIGHFDGVHLGHQYVISRLRQLAEEKGMQRTIAVTFDRHPRTLFDSSFVPKMLSTLSERRHLLSLTGVDVCAVLQFDKEMAAMSARDFMQYVLRDRLDTRVLLLGYDNRFGRKNADEGFEDYVKYGKEMGIEVIACDKLKPSGEHTASSTLIRELLSDGYVDTAMEYLGHPYTMEGIVVEGFHEGRKLGFPTANIDIDPLKVIPVGGVYAVKVRVEGSITSMHGMMNIGHRPTYGENTLTLETNIFRFDDNIYGKRLRVELYKRLRNEQRFPSAYKLSEQLRHDAFEAEKVLSSLSQL